MRAVIPIESNRLIEKLQRASRALCALNLIHSVHGPLGALMMRSLASPARGSAMTPCRRPPCVLTGARAKVTCSARTSTSDVAQLDMKVRPLHDIAGCPVGRRIVCLALARMGRDSGVCAAPNWPAGAHGVPQGGPHSLIRRPGCVSMRLSSRKPCCGVRMRGGGAAGRGGGGGGVAVAAGAGAAIEPSPSPPI